MLLVPFQKVNDEALTAGTPHLPARLLWFNAEVVSACTGRLKEELGEVHQPSVYEEEYDLQEYPFCSTLHRLLQY